MSEHCDFSGFYFKWGEPRTYGLLGVIETLIKLLAVGVAIASLSVYSNDSTRVLSLYRIIEGSLLVALSVWCIVWFVHRVIDREMFAIIFQLFVIFGTGIITVVAFLSAEAESASFIFTVSFLFVLGELVKFMHTFLVEESHITWPRYLTRKRVLLVSLVQTILWVGVLVVQILALAIAYQTQE